MINHLCIFLIFSSFCLQSQNKLIFKNGEIKNVYSISLGNDIVFYKDYDTSFQIKQVAKNDLILVENNVGNVYVFSSVKSGDTLKNYDLANTKRNTIGVQPYGLILLRATFVYERFTKNNKIGFVFPISVSTSFERQMSSGKNSLNFSNSLNVTTGCDVNFYLGKKEKAKFFIGPRVRFGTYAFFDEIYTLQTQIGWRLGNPSKKIIRHFSIGFGFLKILSVTARPFGNNQQFVPWGSVNYRVGIKW